VSDKQADTDAITEIAKKIGFDAIGFARAEELTDAYQRFEKWLERGFHGTMGYMERNKEVRADVSRIVEGANSVIVVAKNYYTPHQHDENVDGKISRYAWGTDYHHVVTEMLDEMCQRITEQHPNATCKRYTDTGAVLEKEWAVRAGLGWQGKHSNVIRRDIGSWFFIGVIITTIPLTPSAIMSDYCGTCTACIQACPTSAITEPYVVDGTKCISYWTIETKPDIEIPSNIAQSLDGWLFGCDVCQDVCPWNRFQVPSGEVKFEPRNNVTHLPPEQVLVLQQETFSDLFRKSPLKRARLGGLQRNARALLSTTNKKNKE
jgi:epoxyqueuosine reductase